MKLSSLYNYLNSIPKPRAITVQELNGTPTTSTELLNMIPDIAQWINYSTNAPEGVFDHRYQHQTPPDSLWRLLPHNSTTFLIHQIELLTHISDVINLFHWLKQSNIPYIYLDTPNKEIDTFYKQCKMEIVAQGYILSTEFDNHSTFRLDHPSYTLV